MSVFIYGCPRRDTNRKASRLLCFIEFSCELTGPQLPSDIPQIPTIKDHKGSTRGS